MSDVQQRPAVARGARGTAARGGRGGFASRGARNASRSATNGDAKHDQETPTSLPTLEDQGEIADLNKAYGSKIETVKAIFNDWSEVDILYALKETDGDDASAIDRILDGKLSCPLLLCPALPRSFLLYFAVNHPSLPPPPDPSTHLPEADPFALLQVPSHSGARSPARRRIGPRLRPRTPSPPLPAPMSPLPTTTGSPAAVVPMLPVVVVAPLSVVAVVLPEADLPPLLPTAPAPRTASLCLFPPTSPTLGTQPRTTMMVAGLRPLLPPLGNLLPPRPTLLRPPPLLLLTRPSP